MEDEHGNPIDPVDPIDPPAADPADPADNPTDPAPVDPEDPAADPEKKDKGVQKRINEITAARRQAENEAAQERAEKEYWRKVATGEIQPQAPQPQGDFIPPNYPAEPTLEQFDDYDQYTRSLAKWEAGRIFAERDYRAEQGKIQAQQQTVQQAHTARIEAAKEKYPDFDEVLASAPRINLMDHTFESILESEQSGEIAYYLAQNPAEAVRINSLSAIQQIKEVARLEDKFKTDTPPVKRISQAPTPINALNGGNGAKDPENETAEEWLARDKARLAKLGRKY